MALGEKIKKYILQKLISTSFYLDICFTFVGPDIDRNQDNVIQRRGTKRKQRSMTAQENDRLPSCSGDSASRLEMNGLVSKALLLLNPIATKFHLIYP